MFNLMYLLWMLFYILVWEAHYSRYWVPTAEQDGIYLRSNWKVCTGVLLFLLLLKWSHQERVLAIMLLLSFIPPTMLHLGRFYLLQRDLKMTNPLFQVLQRLLIWLSLMSQRFRMLLHTPLLIMYRIVLLLSVSQKLNLPPMFSPNINWSHV